MSKIGEKQKNMQKKIGKYFKRNSYLSFFKFTFENNRKYRKTKLYSEIYVDNMSEIMLFTKLNDKDST